VTRRQRMADPVTSKPGRPASAGRREAAAVALILCASIVAFWQIMAARSRRGFEAFELTAADFESFSPRSREWSVQKLPPSPSPIEPNILVFDIRPHDPDGMGAGSPPRVPVAVRLVHGYNMVDCMRIKHYEVELLADTRGMEGARAGASAFDIPDSRKLQAWRLTSSTGEKTLWLTSMLRTGDFAETAVDTRDMAFPRIGIPDPAGWMPGGVTLRSLRHPIRNLRQVMRAAWNNSRCDLLTFLQLRRPAWASREMLTLVATSAGPSVTGEMEQRVAESVLRAHTFIYGELRRWREETGNR